MKKLGVLFSVIFASTLILLSAISPALALNFGKSGFLPEYEPKNIIVMIADGWGYNHVLATDYYQYGQSGTQVYEQFPVQLGMSTYSYGGSYDPAQAWSDFEYVKFHPTHSAEAATAMSTGEKTLTGMIGVDINGNDLEHLLEKAEKMKKSTGVVTSVGVSEATPAGFSAHNNSRYEYEQLAEEMIVESKLDVIMATGHPWYGNDGQILDTPNTFKYFGNEGIWNGLIDGTLNVADADGDGMQDKWSFIETKDQFQSLQSGSTPKRVIGIAQAFTTMQQQRSGDIHADAYEVPFNENVPNLSEMSRAALNVLDNNPKGLVLMIEGGAIDWASHSNETGRMIEEMIDFNQAVEAVTQWVDTNSNWNDTLLIVTGDHETGYLTGPGSNPTWEPVVNNGQNNMPGLEWNSGSHTNSLVPFFAKGWGEKYFTKSAYRVDPVRGNYIDNTDIGNVVNYFNRTTIFTKRILVPKSFSFSKPISR